MSERIEEENSRSVQGIYESLNSLNASRLGEHFADDAALYSLNDAVPPIEGRQAIVQFFEGFFSKAENIKFEVIGEPHALGDIVAFKHIDHFIMDGVKHDDYYVSVILILNGKIKKWLGYIQPDT